MQFVRSVFGSVPLLVVTASASAAHAQAPTPEYEDAFGAVVASGDFNADGYADLAVGVPGQDVNGRADAGSVDVFYGAAVGFSAPQVWTQGAGLSDTAETGDRTGGSIYCANWDQDEYFGAQEDSQTVGLYRAVDELYTPYSVLYTRTGGVRPFQAPISGCAESELYTTEADLQVLLRDHDDFAHILDPATLWTTARHQGCGIGSCTEALVEPRSAGQLEAMRGWW